MIRILCHDCRVVLGYAYLEENYKIDKIDHPFNVRDPKPFTRCASCYAKFQNTRKDLNHTRLLPLVNTTVKQET